MIRSNRLSLLGTGVFARNDRRKNAYRSFSEKSGALPLLDLSLGSSDLEPPKKVVQCIQNAMFDSASFAYCLHSGTRPFREAVACWAKKRFDVRVDPDREVLLLVGSQEGTAHFPMSVLNPGDRGLILDPSYPSHRAGLLLADAFIQRLSLRAEDNWRPSFHTLSNAQLEQLSIMVFGFPHNPIAQVGKQSWLDEAMAIGVRNDVIVAHDNPYVDLALEGEAPALLRTEGWRELGIEFFSFSKAWCMGGLRIAFAIGGEPLISALRDLKGAIDFNQSVALQAGAVSAISEAEDWPNYVRAIYRKRRDKTLGALQTLGWDVPTPTMSLYLWMPLPLWAKQKGIDDETLAFEVLQNTGVALTPGSGFGPGGKEWLRLALVRPVDELEAAISRMKLWWHEQS
ncbi:aminotransferase class I/II-fold pyridoxal phosphate-dependent enzyme [Prochlorococcus sp. MIT 1300]|uniref:aminotransferase class I/II-fold pyridoxal phosphate-dependent enzyme n=1 Tax=Prochlorococcus sp. MIT 1300 TaxID=3096218 RepID=UPI002A75CA41|nr:aminotransferase class I/II-fold pyridoxal phosphate-dependent enzyme [Prochlorococcus sp. MIT 1300]